MARCNSCFGVLTRAESECYVCGEPVPGARKPNWFARVFWPKPQPRAAKPVKVPVNVKEAIERVSAVRH
jgi:hypothetical protein